MIATAARGISMVTGNPQVPAGPPTRAIMAVTRGLRSAVRSTSRGYSWSSPARVSAISRFTAAQARGAACCAAAGRRSPGMPIGCSPTTGALGGGRRLAVVVPWQFTAAHAALEHPVLHQIPHSTPDALAEYVHEVEPGRSHQSGRREGGGHSRP